MVQANPVAGAPGVVTVTGHDHGYVSSRPRSGSHFVDEVCRVVVARADALSGTTEKGITATESAALAVAGKFATVLLEARRLVGDVRTGDRDGVVASGFATTDRGPLADGVLTRTEWRSLLQAVATPTPEAEEGGPRCDTGESLVDQDWNDGSTPVAWRDVPEAFPAHTLIGYGVLDGEALARAGRVLRGEESTVARPDVAAWFDLEHELRLGVHQARSTVHGGG